MNKKTRDALHAARGSLLPGLPEPNKPRGTDLEISDNAFAEAVRRRCACGQEMKKVDRHTFIAGEPPVVKVTWRCGSCDALETVRYSDDYTITPSSITPSKPANRSRF